MHRMPPKRFSALLVSIGLCLAVAGGSTLFSAPAAGTGKTRVAKSVHGKVVQTAPARATRKLISLPKAGQAPATTAITGTVTDGSGHGWPLYARVEFTSDSTEDLAVYTDPETGAYAADLFDGVDYTETVTAVSSGYDSAVITFTSAGLPLTEDVALDAAPAVCNAPGYVASTSFFSESFDAGTLPAGWTVENFSVDGGGPWEIAEGADPCFFFDGNLTGGTGPYAIVNSNCDGFVTDDTILTTPSINLTSIPDPFLTFKLDLFNFDDDFTATVEVSIDGGTVWTTVWDSSGTDIRGPATAVAALTGAGGQANVKVRWHFIGLFEWWWQVDDVAIGTGTCTLVPGGLVVGNVYDANTGDGLNGATVTNLGDTTSTTTFATPDDVNQDDGFYILFSPAGAQDLEATLEKYAADQQTATVVADDAVRQDFTLEAASLTAAPSPLSAVLDQGGTTNQTLTLTNGGGVDSNFEIREIDQPPAPLVTFRFADPHKVRQALARIPDKKKGDRALTARDIPSLPRLADPPKAVDAAGNVIASYPTDLALGWGISFNTDAEDFWVGNLAAGGGDDLDYQYLASDGSQTGETIDNSSWIDVFAADGAYNSRTGMLWRVNVGADTCIYEVDPVAMAPTGNSICPDFGTSERGLAYDPVTDTYYAGSWNDGVINHFDGSGTILDSAFVGLEISGLAYDPRSHHLYAAVNTGGPFDVYVVDVPSYEVLSAFAVKDGGVRLPVPFASAGLEADCEGNLWYVDQDAQQIYKVDSGETDWCVTDIPWLSETPTSGTVAADGGTQAITVTYDATGLQPGLHAGQLVITDDSPYTLPTVPVYLTVRFADVPDANQFQAFIYAAAGAGIMTGCGGSNFCPDGIVTRADMAGYIERALNGPDFLGHPYQGAFGDVTQQTPNANYIQALVDDGITAGCGGGNYCPNDPNTRGQMSVLIVKAIEGSDFVPPACTGIFADVACPGNQFADFIEYLASLGVTVGCGGGNFCPDANISNGQMAVFLVKGFNIPHL